MPKCRFFNDVHEYPQDECDRAYCRAILPVARPRLIPLPPEPNPEGCEHEWLKYHTRLSLPWASKRTTEFRQNPELTIEYGQLAMAEHHFKVCSKCGTVTYLHPELGGPLVCVPLPRGKQ